MQGGCIHLLVLFKFTPLAGLALGAAWAQTAIGLSWMAPAANAASRAAVTGYKTDALGESPGLRASNSPLSDYFKGRQDFNYQISQTLLPPGPPTNLSAKADGQTAIDLNWTAPMEGGETTLAPAGYKVEVSNDGITGWGVLVTINNAATTTYEHSGLSGGTTRHYRVRATSSAGDSPPSETAQATTNPLSPPLAPTALIATADGQTAIDLSWSAPVPDAATRAAVNGYKLEASKDGSTDWTQVGITNRATTTFKHSGLSGGTTRHYRVRATSSAGDSPPSETAQATTDPLSVPLAPTTLIATADGQTAIDLSWNAPVPDAATRAAVNGYKVEVSNDGSTGWTQVGITNNVTTTYEHSSLSGGTTRHYRVRATSSAGDSPPSNVASATTHTWNALLKAWLARFGRSVADQVVDGVNTRLQADGQASAHVTVAGQPIDLSGNDIGTAVLDTMEDWLSHSVEDRRAPTVTSRQLLHSSSFHLPFNGAAAPLSQTGSGGRPPLPVTSPWTLWGQGAFTSFDGREGETTLDGQVSSAMVGADWSRQELTLGLALSHHRGEGEYRGDSQGEMASSLTGLYPYGHYQLSERLSFWAVGGYGYGNLTLRPEGDRSMTTDMDLALGAAGGRGLVVAAPAEGGLELTVNSDAMVVRTTSQQADRGMAAVDTQVTRLRLGLEGTWQHDGAITPSLEVALRHEGGDAETGMGLEVGGALRYTHPSSALSAQLSTRTLVVHSDEHYRQWGISGALVLEADTAGHGLSFSLKPSWGNDASLAEQLLAGDGSGLSQLVASHHPHRGRLDAQLGYGLPAFAGAFTATPNVGVTLSDVDHELRLGWRLQAAGHGSSSLDLEATRRNTDDHNAEYGLHLKIQTSW